MLKGYYLGQVAHLCCNKLGPDNNLHLAQIITFQHGRFFAFFAPPTVLQYLFLQRF